LNNIPGVVTNGIFSKQRAQIGLFGSPEGLKVIKPYDH